MTELLRASVKQLERFRHPKILQIIHTVEECPDTLAFATEPVLASLANILAYNVSFYFYFFLIICGQLTPINLSNN